MVLVVPYDSLSSAVVQEAKAGGKDTAVDNMKAERDKQNDAQHEVADNAPVEDTEVPQALQDTLDSHTTS